MSDDQPTARGVQSTHRVARQEPMSLKSREMPEMLKPSEVAVRLRVSRTWLYDAAKAGLIPSIRLPSTRGGEGPLRFLAEDVEHWIQEARASWTPGRRRTPGLSRSQTATRRRAA